jgi:hypothetical protein
MLKRERIPVSWLQLIRIYRRVELRGELRGGRFIAGFARPAATNVIPSKPSRLRVFMSFLPIFFRGRDSTQRRRVEIQISLEESAAVVSAAFSPVAALHRTSIVTPHLSMRARSCEPRRICIGGFSKLSMDQMPLPQIAGFSVPFHFLSPVPLPKPD